MVAVQEVYLSAAPHRNSLAAVGVVFGHALDRHRPDLLDGAVIHIVRGRDLEVVLRVRRADELRFGLEGVGQPILPGPHRAEAVAHLVIPHPGGVVQAAPSHREANGHRRRRGDGQDRGQHIVNHDQRLYGLVASAVGDCHRDGGGEGAAEKKEYLIRRHSVKPIKGCKFLLLRSTLQLIKVKSPKFQP